jgi:hypothetical protein
MAIVLDVDKLPNMAYDIAKVAPLPHNRQLMVLVIDLLFVSRIV